MTLQEDSLEKTLLDRRTIQRRVEELGAAISRDFAGQEITVVPILNGAVIFAADLLRAITVPASLDSLEVASYDGTETTASVTVIKHLRTPVTGKNVLIVEDIVDTGITMAFVLEHLRAQAPGALRVCALLSKPDRRRTAVNIDYLGFSIPDEFVVGYGLDYRGHFRNLPDIRVFAGAGDCNSSAISDI